MKPSSVIQINGRSDNKLPKIQEKNGIADCAENTKNTSTKWKKILIYSTILVLISASCHFILKNENLFNLNIENIFSKIFKCVSIGKFKVVYISLVEKVIDIQNRLWKTIGRDYIEVLFKLKLMLINLKYGLNIALSNVRYQYKRIARKYGIIILFQAIIYRLFKFVINLIMLIRKRVMDIIIESSNSSFYFYLFVVLLVLVLFWDNVVMREYCNDFRVKNFKIITSTISTLVTVFYFPVIEKILFILVEVVFSNIYSFCSKAYLGINASEQILNSGYYSYNHDDVVEFSIISKNWWRSRKLDSVFKGVELINEVKKRYGEKKSNLGVVNTIKEIGISGYINNGGKISKEFCNTVLNGNLNLRVGLRVTTLLMGTLSTLLILNKEKRKFNQNRGEKIYSKAYLILIVISGIFIPILINNIQKISNYSDQGKVISILLFLTFKIVTNYNHFLSLTMIIIDDLKSRLKNKNDIERIFTLNNNMLNESNLYCTGMTEKNIKNKVDEGNVTKFPEVKEVSSLFKEKNRKASLVLKTNTNYKSSRTNPKCNTNSRSCLNRESSNNLIKIGKVNEVLRKNIASKVGVKEELGENSDLREIRNEKSVVKTIKNIINKIINLFKSVFLNSLVNTFLYISNGNYRGKVLSPMDHYKLNKYINKSKISINIIEELLKSMTLCYTNIGNRKIIKLITIKKTELIDELNNFKQILPESEILSKLSLYKGNNNHYNYSELSKLEKIIYPFSLTLSLEDKINVQVNYYMLLNSIEILTCNCETIKISCRAIINSECLIELINNISNNDVDKITRLLSSKMDYKTISDILISSIFAINNKSNILNKFSLVNNSYNRVNHELVENLSRLNNVDTKEIFTQWNILRSGLKVVLHEIKENRRSYEDAYMGGLPLHTLQMSLHYLNTLARKTSDLVQESIIACSEFCLYFNLKTLDELNELNSTSSGQLKLFDLCIKDCKDILNLIKTIKNVMIDICDQKLRIEGKEMDISYLSSLLPSMISNNDHKCCRKENESSCKLHGKGLKDTYKLYSEGNCPAVIEIGVNNSIINSNNEKTEKFIPERPKSSIPRESSTRRNNHEQKSYDDNDLSPSLQTSLRRPASINNKSIDDSNTNNNLKNTDNLPFLIETPGEKQNIQQM
ncbi:hypothetical protein FG379_003684 [Cryptosporidium bovis]|uniref:uncharacterized protein n=1 Tax=Cryptosporidium bovis TaxID=310047 RepID=UPI00351A3A56|nr:hypothetical protein FG379_003684 [Cryptosporidium bovis]